MKIALYCGNSAFQIFGGAERVFCNFANEFVRRGCDVAAIVDERTDAPPVYPLDERVRYYNLQCVDKTTAAIRVAKVWRETTRPLRKTPLKRFFPDFVPDLKVALPKRKLDAVLADFQPDVVIPFFLTDLRRLFYRRPKVDFATIQTLHGDVEHSIPDPESKRTRALLDRCDVVQVLADAFVPGVRRLCSTRVVAIPNVVPQFDETVDFDERERAATKNVVYFARFDKAGKRQRLLIDAFAKIAASRPDWNLRMFGAPDRTGEYVARLHEQIKHYSLIDRVFIYPPTTNVKEELLRSDIFAFPSAYEGFGLALAEAQSAGLPTIGFRSVPAVAELIDDGRTGFLADDGVDDFARKLATLIDSKELRAKFGAAAKKRIVKYAPARIWNDWANLIDETVARKRRAQRFEQNDLNDLNDLSKLNVLNILTKTTNTTDGVCSSN